jgi:hypothetical protein
MIDALKALAAEWNAEGAKYNGWTSTSTTLTRCAADLDKVIAQAEKAAITPYPPCRRCGETHEDGVLEPQVTAPNATALSSLLSPKRSQIMANVFPTDYMVEWLRIQSRCYDNDIYGQIADELERLRSQVTEPTPAVPDEQRDDMARIVTESGVPLPPRPAPRGDTTKRIIIEQTERGEVALVVYVDGPVLELSLEGRACLFHAIDALDEINVIFEPLEEPNKA